MRGLFFNQQQLPYLLRNAEVKASLESAFVGFDAARHYYYHWLLYGISKTQLANVILPKDTILALPSQRSLFENRYCVYTQQTYNQILDATKLVNRATFLIMVFIQLKNCSFSGINP